MTWLPVRDYMCNKWPRICCSVVVMSSFRIYHRLLTRVTRRVPLVEQALLIFPEHLCSPQAFCGVRVTRSLVFSVEFCISFFVILSFFFCIVFPSSIYGFCLVTWYLQTFSFWLIHNKNVSKISTALICSLEKQEFYILINTSMNMTIYQLHV